MTTKPAAQNERFGLFVALCTAGLALISFGIGIFTPPLSGPFCPAGCFEYPYHDIASRFPRDYLWMYPALLLTASYMALMAVLHSMAESQMKVYSLTGLVFSVSAGTLLLMNLFVQVSVVQPSLLKGETEGIALLTQFNPHGLFIVLEELGYLLMGLSFLCVAPLFFGASRLQRSIGIIFALAFPLMLLALVLISLQHGLDREYRFEVAAISIAWTVLIINPILLARWLKRSLK